MTAGFPDPAARMEDLLAELLSATLRSMGAAQLPAPVDRVMAATGIIELYRPWLAHSLTAAAGDLAPAEVWRRWDRFRSAVDDVPALRGKLGLLDLTLRALPNVLTGRVSATEVLFPGGDMARVEAVYRDNPEADAGRQAVAVAVERAAVAAARPAGELRILEVGAGTGATTSAVLDRVDGTSIGEYAFTDVSASFLVRARAALQPCPFVTYQQLDIERDPQLQGFPAYGYDVVVAANVLHATQSVRATLRHVKTLLKPAGVLIAHEIVAGSLFAHLTFGLTTGWWRFTDGQLRLPGGPALDVASWRRVLAAEGFRNVAVPDIPGTDPGLRVITATSDGVIRRRSPQPPAPAGSSTGTTTPGRPGPAASPAELGARCLAHITAVVAGALGTTPERIAPDEPLTTYGLDSLIVIQVTKVLRDTFGAISSTLLFDHPTTGELAAFLAASRRVEAERAFGITPPPSPVASASIPPASATGVTTAVSGPADLLAERRTGRPGSATTDGIAVVGLAGRYPGAADVDKFWENLRAGRRSITEVPPSRWDWRAYYHPERGRRDAMYTRWGGFVDDVDAFDSLFFRISPAEAESMDPQERLFLETAYSAVEDAGYRPDALAHSGRVGVFVGVMNGNYPTGANFWSVANRVSFTLDLRGPSLAVDTACSSSLTAIHLAMESLRGGGSEVAIAGGVNLIVDPRHYLRLTALTMLSAGDRCRAFGAGSDGFVDGEGVGAVVLKPLTRAVADGDHIYGVLTGSAINASGRTGGYTVPSTRAQAAVVREALDRAGVEPGAIGYVEAHGTGTSLGDPIEVAGLTAALGDGTADRQSCALGSVKPNIGHTESAAGVASLTKVLLQLAHGQIAPSLDADPPNPEIDFAGSRFFVPQTLVPWPRTTDPASGVQARRAGVSSFGAGGANAHLIVEEYRPEEATPVSISPPYLVVLSARTGEDLRESVRRLSQAVDRNDWTDGDLPHLAHTLRVGRRPMRVRLAFAVASIEELAAALDGHLAAESAPPLPVGSTGDLARRWLDGEDVDWATVLPCAGLRRMSLPTYPFRRRRHWLPTRQPAGTAATPGGTAEPSISGRPEDAQPLLFAPQWAPVTDLGAAAVYARHTVLVCGGDGTDAVLAIRARFPEADVRPAPAAGAGPAERFVAAATAVIAELTRMLRAGVRGRSLLQIAVSGGEAGEIAGGLAAMARTAGLEHPRLTIQVIEVEQPTGVGSAADLLVEAAGEGSSGHFREIDGGWQRWRLAPITAPSTVEHPWRDSGVYLITGGAGALGLRVARDIAERVSQPALILVGRSDPAPDRVAAMEAIEALGASVVYWQADVARRTEVNELVAGVLARFGTVHGIVHCSGLTRDAYLLHTPVEGVREVLAPKVLGAEHLDLATRDLPLDLFVLFSSAAAAFGNVGQATYGAANGYLDAFAARRNRLVATGARRGRTVAIGWPVWQHGGMRIDDASLAELLARTGTTVLTDRAAMRALSAALASGCDHVIPLPGDHERIMEFVLKSSATAASAVAPTARPLIAGPRTAQPAETPLRGRVVDYLIAQLTEIAKIARADLDEDEPYESYGLNSVMIARWNLMLAERFPEAPKTLFFETRNIGATADYLLDQHPDGCAALAGGASRSTTPASVAARTATVPAAPVHPGRHREREPIAVIGIAGRYPLADNLDEYWQNLVTGRDCITEIPPERWDLDGFYEPDADTAVATGRSYGKWGGFVSSFADFDPLFFRMSAREAMSIDPQERLFMTVCWEALEDAGYTREELARRHNRDVGVFAGITKTGFNLFGPDLWRSGQRQEPHTSFASAANRVSHVLDLHGPSMPIDTMCSSSLVAIHEACEHIHSGDCQLAFAGGVNLYLHPSNYIGMASHRMLSVDGRCKSFGRHANGYVPGEGVGVVLLKPLSAALADRDNIHAVISGTAVNHGGRTHGYTVPNPDAQRALVRTSLDRAGVHARSVTCIEAHGTGTDLGDPIEISGLTQAFRADTADVGFCPIGSVKSNIGHLEAAAGIAGLTKVILQLRHGTLVPSLHAAQSNPNIRFEQTPFRLQRERGEWTAGVAGRPRVAGVSSFGAGGANAHVTVAEHIVTRPAYQGRGPVPVILSARTKDQLHAKVVQILAAIEGGVVTDETLWDAAYTLQVGRESMAERLGAVVSTVTELAALLQAYLGGRQVIGVHQGTALPPGRLRDVAAGYEPPSVLLDQHAYDRLLAVWCLGVAVDWAQLYGPDRPNRISLPTYPFARVKLWIRDLIGAPGRAAAPAVPPIAPPTMAPSVATPTITLSTLPSIVSDPGSAPRVDPAVTGAAPTMPVDRAPAEPTAAASAPTAARLTLAELPPIDPLPDGAAEPVPGQTGPRAADRSPSAPDMLEDLAGSLAAILAIDRHEIDPDRQFVDLGLDSIIGVEWIQALNRRYGLAFTGSTIYNYPTMREFSAFLAAHLSGSEPAEPAPVSAGSLRELIEQVRRGTVRPDQAERLLHLVDDGLAR